MSIRASSAKHVDSLIADLTGTNAVKREAAVARLTVIGARAVDRLVDLVDSSADAAVRTAALRALEGIGDERGLPAALKAADAADHPTALAAIAVVRLSLRGARGAGAVDRLTTIALDSGRSDAVRAAAVSALRDLGPKTIAPLLKTLGGGAGLAADTDVPGAASADPSAVREWLTREGANASLAALLDVVERARERESAERPPRRGEWATTRAAAHVALARRGSRVGLYDVKEWLEQSGAPLPVDTLAALAIIGDASCLEPIASAYARSKDAWWRDHLLDAFHAIVKRERLTKRHAVMKRVERKWGLAGRARPFSRP